MIFVIIIITIRCAWLEINDSSKYFQRFINISHMRDSKDNKTSWNQEDEQLLFNMHIRYGNKWSLISTHMPGRSDNCLKNKFYSTLRKGYRKMNKYIGNIRRKRQSVEISTNKYLKPDFLTKLAAIADRNFEEKFEVKPKALQSSKSIQEGLIELARNKLDYERNDMEDYIFQQKLLGQIQEFNRNCKKRKGKRKEKQESRSSELQQSVQQQNIQVLQEQKNYANAINRSTNTNSSDVLLVAQKSYKSDEIDSIKKQSPVKDDSTSIKSQNVLQKLQQILEHEQQLFPKNDSFLEEQQFGNAYMNEHLKTPTTSMVSSIHRSLLSMMDPSPGVNNHTSFSQALLANIKLLQNSRAFSINSGRSSLLQSLNFRDPDQLMDFMQKIPMMHNSQQIPLFNSAQIGKISENSTDEKNSIGERQMSQSQNFDKKSQYTTKNTQLHRQSSKSIKSQIRLQSMNIQQYQSRKGEDGSCEILNPFE